MRFQKGCCKWRWEWWASFWLITAILKIKRRSKVHSKSIVLTNQRSMGPTTTISLKTSDVVSTISHLFVQKKRHSKHPITSFSLKKSAVVSTISRPLVQKMSRSNQPITFVSFKKRRSNHPITSVSLKKHCSKHHITSVFVRKRRSKVFQTSIFFTMEPERRQYCEKKATWIGVNHGDGKPSWYECINHGGGVDVAFWV